VCILFWLEFDTFPLVSTVMCASLLILKKIFIFRTEDVVMLHPHSVPDYDFTEQQILDSIEKEFVS